MIKIWQQEIRKAEEKAKRESEAEEATRKRADEARQVRIEEDANLPAAEKIKIRQAEDFRGKRIKVCFKFLPILVFFKLDIFSAYVGIETIGLVENGQMT